MTWRILRYGAKYYGTFLQDLIFNCDKAVKKDGYFHQDLPIACACCTLRFCIALTAATDD